MMVIVNALTPVLALILLGFLIKRSEFVPSSFWPSAEKLTYYLLMPATLIHSLAGKEIGASPWFNILLTVWGAALASVVFVGLGWLTHRRMGGPVFTSLFQGGVRFNTFVALALAENLFGKEGLFLASLGAGFMIMIVNVLTVTAFSVAVGSGGLDVRRVARDLFRNPLIWGCVLGIGLNVSGLKLPAPLDGSLVLLGKAAFPVGLLAVGAAYQAGNIARHWQPIAASCGIQFVCKPVVAWWLATATGLSGIAAGVAVLIFSVPTAPTAYILSRQMGGDHDSMAVIITVQTCLSFLTLPLTLWLLS
ncbi:transporter [Geomonas limicola]|uniref:Transporter n=1 Tax=Geomonas limicola TaxID=2740186 RepID=A0A6V8N6K5_9BACT|nr:AEC family transporter [Geomonas limicola]GFO68208.1 transporter [Geomonas limicola]